MSIVDINAADLLAVLPAKARQDIRYYLNGILVEPCDDGCMLVATNGHVLAAIRSESTRADQPRLLNIPDRSADQIRKEVRRNGLYRLTIESETAHAVLSNPKEERYVIPGKPFIDGTFPDWRRVVPPLENLKPALPAAVDPDYLAFIRDCVPPAPCRTPVKFWHDDRNPEANGFVVRAVGFRELVMVIMPMRGDPWPAWPTWMK